MKVNLKQPFLDYAGVEQDEGGRIVNIGDILLTAINTPLEADAKLGSAAKMDLYRLGLDAAQKDEITLTPEQVVLITERGAQTLHNLPYGRLMDAVREPAA